MDKQGTTSAASPAMPPGDSTFRDDAPPASERFPVPPIDSDYEDESDRRLQEAVDHAGESVARLRNGMSVYANSEAELLVALTAAGIANHEILELDTLDA